MMKLISNLPVGCLGISAEGTVTEEDYQQVLAPLLEEVHQQGWRVRLLYHLGPSFESFTAGAAWQDMRLGWHYLRLFERCAVVSDVSWVNESMRWLAVLMPCPMRAFANREWDEALAWLTEPSPTSGLTYGVLPDKGVLLIEPHGPLRSEDFESIAAAVDPWIESHGGLQGIVVHAPHFPGWQSVGSLVRHLRFVSNHQRKIGRVALAADGQLAELGPMLAGHFVEAELKHFGYDQLEDAVEWASAKVEVLGDGQGPAKLMRDF
jgi:hypothetical protein